MTENNRNRRVKRIWNEEEKEKHGQQVSERFRLEREDKKRQATLIIEEMLDLGITISQNEVARRTGFSSGWVNQHLRVDINRAQQKQRDSAKKLRTSRQVDIEAKELERLRLSNRRLRDQLDEQHRMNQALLAQVSEVVYWENEAKVQRMQCRELQAALDLLQAKPTEIFQAEPGHISTASEHIEDRVLHRE